MGFSTPKKHRNERARRWLKSSLGGTGKTSSPGAAKAGIWTGGWIPSPAAANAGASYRDNNPAPAAPKAEASSVKENKSQAEIVPAKELEEFEDFLNKLEE